MEIPSYQVFKTLDQDQILAFYQSLEEGVLDEDTIEGWMMDWSSLRKLVDERYARLQLANAQDTRDDEAETRYFHFIEAIYPVIEKGDQQLKQKFLSSGRMIPGMELPHQKMQLEADLFREQNLSLMTEERKLGSKYNKIFGAQTVDWNGEELTIARVKSLLTTSNRANRKKLWTRLSSRQLEDRQAINSLWSQLMKIRIKIAENAGKSDYRAFRWQQQLRMDYSPQDSLEFLAAIKKVVVPAATRTYHQYQEQLGIDRVRPWDLGDNRTTFLLPAIQAFKTEDELISCVGAIFNQVDARLGEYFEVMVENELLDLMNRKGKGPGAFCTSFATQNLPFIFMNAVGQSSDIRVLFHECGHAFHVFERSKLPYHHQWRAGMEFSEVASTAMELLASPFLESTRGGFLTSKETARVRIQHLQEKLLFWPYMAVVVAFQHWVYQNHQTSQDVNACDQQWADLIDEYMPGVDWSGWEDVKQTGWQRKLHIHKYPFYYIEYGLALLGAVQIWQLAEKDRTEAIKRYREALAMGGTASIPDLFETAGAKLAFDTHTLHPAIRYIEAMLESLAAKL